MPLTAAELVTLLEGKGVSFTQHQHGPVMTVEAQEAALQGSQGVVIKNLFLKDKKNRLYVVSALPQTKVDLNALSARLGTGKGGLKFAAEELLQEVLQVPAGSVTPLVVANPEAIDVVLFLDTHIQSASTVFVHPLVNTTSLGMTPAALVQALQAVGREPIWVDLELEPKIDKDHPPDLAQHTVAPPPKPDAPAAGAAPAAASNGSNSTAAASGGAGNSQQAQKKGAKPGAGKAGQGSAPDSAAASEYEQHQAFTAVSETTQQLLDLVSQALLGGPLAAHAATLDAYTLRRLTADMESRLSSFKNAAYALGYNAGKGEVEAFAQRRFS